MKQGLKFAIFFWLFTFSSCSYYFGNSWAIKPQKGKQVSTQKIIRSAFAADSNDLLIRIWALKEFPDWKTEGKVNAPRVLLAKLIAGRDIEKVNEYLNGKRPWGKNGTEWAFNPHGDYDFSEVPLMAILYMFGDKPELLFSVTKENLLNRLLTHSGNKIHLHAPGTLGMLRETENHIFMGETSRYLKNQWLYEHGDTTAIYNNAANGLNNWWLACLNQKSERGFFEFNANPYSGYSLTALLTFYSFCHNEEVREKCGELLNNVFARYAYSSLTLRRYPPFRRRMERQNEEKFAEDPVTSIVQTLLCKQKIVSSYSNSHHHHALLTLISNYQLPDSVVALLKGNKREYFIKAGHEYRSCPEIYSGGADYLLSAGGAQRGRISQIAVHPIVLFLNDSAAELKQCFYLPGYGKPAGWNMTGVYHQFACANHPVEIPSRYTPVYQKNGWQIFKPYANKLFYVLIYNAANLGLLAVIPHSELRPEELVSNAIQQNGSGNLRSEVVMPFSKSLKLEYDVEATKKNWVIKAVNGEKQNRNFDKWKY